MTQNQYNQLRAAYDLINKVMFEGGITCQEAEDLYIASFRVGEVLRESPLKDDPDTAISIGEKMTDFWNRMSA